ncbi:MAG: hypothetical protein AB8B87_22975 [Granulosicoccus sp.]
MDVALASGFDLPRFAGLPILIRLPYVPLDHPQVGDVDIGRADVDLVEVSLAFDTAITTEWLVLSPTRRFESRLVLKRRNSYC